MRERERERERERDREILLFFHRKGRNVFLAKKGQSRIFGYESMRKKIKSHKT